MGKKHRQIGVKSVVVGKKNYFCGPIKPKNKKCVMYVYKFRVTTDEVEDFVRDIEVLAGQTFEDLHKIILKSVELKEGELASFYICNQRWTKKIEVSLMDMGEDPSFSEHSMLYEGEDETDSEKMEKMVMNKVALCDLIDDPHQKMIYEYDYFNTRVFYLELQKAYKAEDGVEYPRCIARKGKLPTKASPLVDLKEPSFSEDCDGYDEEELEDLFIDGNETPEESDSNEADF